MALTSRGKAAVAGGAFVAVLGGGMAALALSGNAPDPVQEALHKIGVMPAPAEPCPLTGETLPGDKQPPDRPVLAIKVENTPDAQPLAGLQNADIVYEEVVEGGITRFVALYHCEPADRIGPVRSIRTTDPKILAPFSDHPLLAFSGGSRGVRNIVEDAARIATLTIGTTHVGIVESPAAEAAVRAILSGEPPSEDRVVPPILEAVLPAFMPPPAEA